MPAKRMQSSSSTSGSLAAPVPHHQTPDATNLHAHQLSPSVKPSPSLPSITRSTSPSGLTNFFTRPTKWFTRTSSGSRSSPVGENPAGRVSTSSSASSRRRPTISGPTDPRPIESIPSPGIDSKLTGTGLGVGMGGLASLSDRASRSVLDLSSRASTDLNGATARTGSNGTGDLRAIARKGWSRSVDNLQILPPTKLPPLNTSTSVGNASATDLEMKIEQYRTGTPTTPASFASSVNQKIYPFPTMPGTPSTPPSDLNIYQYQRQLRHAHSNSGSSSSLGTAGGVPSPSTRLAPPMPSPQKAVRKRSFDFERSKGKSIDSGTSFAGGGRSGVGFPFFHAERKNSAPVTPAPPTIIEPRSSSVEGEDQESSKRASQIVHRSGFILRLPNFSPSSCPSLSSNKNWKPFKMILKGSKLYFYKPPGDRTAAIKGLFPNGLVAVIEEGNDEEEDQQQSRQNRDRDETRKKRAFWGRRTHPDLVVENGQIVKGSLEALVHESVFATTFKMSRTDAKQEAQESENDNGEWKSFASTILFFVPYLVDRARFEYEFQRCASYFVGGASSSSGSEENKDEAKLDPEKENARARVGWLVAKYIEYHTTPVDEESWRGFCKDVVPATVSVSGKAAIGGGPTSPVLQLSPSPDLSAPSPRPGDSGHRPSFSASPTTRLSTPRSNSTPSPSVSPSLLSAASPMQSIRSSSTTNTPPSRLRLWSMLDSVGFTREVFFKFEPDTVARSSLLYQKSVLEASYVNSRSVNAEVILAETPLTPLVEFFGCDENPHWLTRMVVMQILGPGTSSAAVALADANAGDGYHNQGSFMGMVNSRTHVRAEVIARWARVGEMSRLAGDECSWRVIMSALTSKPIARLDKAWRRVDSTAMNIVRGWAYPPASAPSSSSEAGETRANVVEPRVSPWGGDGRQRAMKIFEKLQEGKSNEWALDGMYEARRIFDEFVGSVDACRSQGRSGVRSREPTDEEDASHLAQYWKELSKRPPPLKIHRIDQFMSLSLAAEPKKRGLFGPYYWTRQSSAYQGPQVLVPLLFPELLPTVTLVDRSQLVRTKKLSYETCNVLGDGQSSRPSELIYHVDPDGRIRAGGVVAARRGSAGLDLRGMILPVFDGELLLCVVANAEGSSTSRPVSSVEGTDTTTQSQADSAANSAGPSRQPSIRVKSAAAGLDRKSSRARRASLPALSRIERAPPAVVVVEPTGEPPLHAVIQAGTLDALVHFLIHGLAGVSVSVADDNGEMVLSDKKTRAVKVDRTEFARVWWSSFRSFVTPYVFFQLLRKDFLSSFTSRGSQLPEEVVQGVQARHAVIRVIAEWIYVGGGAQDALDDVELHAAMQSFLAQQAEQDLSKLASQSENLSSLLREYEAERVSVLGAFKTQAMRPQLRNIPVRGQPTSSGVASEGGGAHDFGTRPPKLEEITPIELVDNIDAMASAAFRNVTQEDVYVTVDLLEVQTFDRTGWFLPREPTSTSDEVEIQSLYTYLTEVEPSSLAGEYSGETLYRLFPPGIRSLLRAFIIIRKWAICCLAAPQLGIKARQARMEMLLKAIEICRTRSTDDQSNSADAATVNPATQPRVRSFVEAVLTSAIVSPESRMFSRAWQNVANARGAQMESICSLLSTRNIEPLLKKERLTVDPAWLLERMLEVISLSDVLDSPMDMETPLSLVNYDKRRQLHNMITNISSYVNRGNRQHRELDRVDFDRLNRIEQEFGDVIFDLRLLRDEAQREAASLGPPPTANRKGAVRPFSRVVATQQEKIKRDRYLRERLMREKRHEQQRLERKEDDLNRAMDIRGQSQASSQKHMRGKRSMSALFSLMRPISTAFTSELGGGGGIIPKRSAAELDFTPTHKPALALSLVDAHVSAFINNERSFTFQIDTEDGGHYLLQALSKNDMSQWMQTISTAIRTHAQRRLTYIGNSSPIQVTDHVQPRPITASRDPRAVFGVDLTFLVRREAGGEEVSPDAVPSVLELCLKEIEERGLTEQGIYRVAGATTEVNALREALNNGQRHIDRYTDINAVAGVVKYWFRTLPETVIPEAHFEPIIAAARIADLDKRLARIREIVHSFPRSHFSVLKRLAEHMDRVVDYEEQNHMTPDNLAVVICPNLLRAPNNNFGLIMTNMGPMTVLFKALITHMHLIFDEDIGEAEEGEDGDGDVEEEEFVESEEKAHADSQSLFVPEPDLGPRFVASPEPDELLQDIGSSPD